MTRDELLGLYQGYVACLNRQDWSRLGEFVADDVQRNGEALGLTGYRTMLERDFAAVPDLRFAIDVLACDPPHVAARLLFDCTPVGRLFGLPVDGRRVTFSENVFYRIAGGKIERVWSLIDRAAIEAQL